MYCALTIEHYCNSWERFEPDKKTVTDHQHTINTYYVTHFPC